MIDEELISFEIPSKIIQSDRNINDIFPHSGIPILILIMYNKKRNEDRRLHPVR